MTLYSYGENWIADEAFLNMRKTREKLVLPTLAPVEQKKMSTRVFITETEIIMHIEVNTRAGTKKINFRVVSELPIVLRESDVQRAVGILWKKIKNHRSGHKAEMLRYAVVYQLLKLYGYNKLVKYFRFYSNGEERSANSLVKQTYRVFAGLGL